MYIDTSNVTYTEEYEPNHAYIFEGPCILTGNKQSVKIPGNELYNLRHKDGLIQHLCPSLNASEREWIKTGYSKEGWEKLFNNR